LNQADDIFEKIREIGYDVVFTGSSDVPVFSFSPDEVEILASREHERWVHERINEGWVYGEEKSILEKVNPCLIPYKELSEEVKDKDRDPVREIPGLLASIGFQIVRKEATISK